MKYTKIRWLCEIYAFAICFMLTGCHLRHDWQEATCTEPRTCLTGGETEGKALGHTWLSATCTEPKTCSVCGETKGEALGHDYLEANYQQPATCQYCGETEGEPLEADFEKNGYICDVELDTPYSYTTLCGNDSGFIQYTTTGTVTFTDYSIISPDETYEALDGYEWLTLTLNFTFNDDNAREYGLSAHGEFTDYYDMQGFRNSWDDDSKTFTVNYNGEDYTECMCLWEQVSSGWSFKGFTYQLIFHARIPEGYDGFVIYADTNTGADDTLYLRL